MQIKLYYINHIPPIDEAKLRDPATRDAEIKRHTESMTEFRNIFEENKKLHTTVKFCVDAKWKQNANIVDYILEQWICTKYITDMIGNISDVDAIVFMTEEFNLLKVAQKLPDKFTSINLIAENNNLDLLDRVLRLEPMTTTNAAGEKYTIYKDNTPDHNRDNIMHGLAMLQGLTPQVTSIIQDMHTLLSNSINYAHEKLREQVYINNYLEAQINQLKLKK